MDALSTIVDLAQLGRSVIGCAELLPPWGLEVGPDAKAVVHLVQRGVCWLRLARGTEPIRLSPGDAVLVPRGTRHVVSDDIATPGEPYLQALLARLLAREARGESVGSELVIPRLIDSLLVALIRSWLDSQPLHSIGWFGALRDPQVGRALGLIHQAPQHRWTVAELATRVGQSRAAFARHFVNLVGEPPMAYVTRWRVNLAAKRLRSTGDSIEAIAEDVGYDSPTAFGKAFRKHFGHTPGRYRHRAGVDGLAASVLSASTGAA